MAERWLPLPGFEGVYRISSLGRIVSIQRRIAGRAGKPRVIPEREIAGRIHKVNGYQQVRLSDATTGRRVDAYVHRLVLTAFVGAAPAGHECCHANGDRTDNRLDNLRWDSRAANMKDALKHGTIVRGESVSGAKLTAETVRSIRQSKQSRAALAASHGVSVSLIGQVLTRKIWRHVP